MEREFQRFIDLQATMRQILAGSCRLQVPAPKSIGANRRASSQPLILISNSKQIQPAHIDSQRTPAHHVGHNALPKSHGEDEEEILYTLKQFPSRFRCL